MAKILVLGLGNDLLSDDAAGLQVAAEVRRRCAAEPAISVVTTTESGAALLDKIVGYEGLVIVDSIRTGTVRPGHIHAFSPRRYPPACPRAPHALGIEETCALGRSLGLETPRHVRIIAIEVEDPFTLGTDMTPEVEAAIETAADRAVASARELAGGGL